MVSIKLHCRTVKLFNLNYVWMGMITLNTINDVYNEELTKARRLFPSNWAHVPLEKVETMEHKRYLGLASHTGQVSVNELFLNTSATSLLINTIKHEICHLIVGTHQNHNAKFKRIASILGVKNNNEFEELEQIITQINYKYTVFAHMENGDVIDLGGVHKKTRLYTEYNPEGKRKMKIKGQLIIRFEFVNN